MNSTKMRSGFTLMLALTMTGCGSAVVTTTQQSFAPGTCVGVVVTNEGVQGLHYDHCYAPLERLDGDVWTRLPQTDEEWTCLLNYRSVSSGGSAGFAQPLPSELEAGTYRFAVQLNWVGFTEGPRFEEVTPPFSVAGPASDAPCDFGAEGFDP